MKLSDYRKISAAVEADLKAALAKHGLALRPFGAKIDERLGIVRMTLEAADVNHKSADGSATTPEAEIYKSNCLIFDLKPEWLNQPFRMNGTTFKIVGMKLRGNKCILIEKDTAPGKIFVATPEQVRVYWLAQSKTAA
jgi:hypothetical protein